MGDYDFADWLSSSDDDLCSLRFSRCPFIDSDWFGFSELSFWSSLPSRRNSSCLDDNSSTESSGCSESMCWDLSSFYSFIEWSSSLESENECSSEICELSDSSFSDCPSRSDSLSDESPSSSILVLKLKYSSRATLSALCWQPSQRHWNFLHSLLISELKMEALILSWWS